MMQNLTIQMTWANLRLTPRLTATGIGLVQAPRGTVSGAPDFHGRAALPINVSATYSSLKYWSNLGTATEGSGKAMPSWPMIEYRAETWCLLVTHSLSHVGLTLLGIASPTLGSSSSSSSTEWIAYTINCVHSHIIPSPVESPVNHSAVS
jgi:hypothetical protein